MSLKNDIVFKLLERYCKCKIFGETIDHIGQTILRRAKNPSLDNAISQKKIKNIQLVELLPRRECSKDQREDGKYWSAELAKHYTICTMWFCVIISRMHSRMTEKSELVSFNMCTIHTLPILWPLDKRKRLGEMNMYE